MNCLAVQLSPKLLSKLVIDYGEIYLGHKKFLNVLINCGNDTSITSVMKVICPTQIGRKMTIECRMKTKSLFYSFQ